MLLPVLQKILNHSFCLMENLHCNFHNVGNSNCTFRIVKNISKYFHIVKTFPSTKFLWLFNSGSFYSILSTFHMVYWIFSSTYFAHCGTLIILLPVMWKILNHSFHVMENLLGSFPNVHFAHCGKYHKVLFILWKAFLPQNSCRYLNVEVLLAYFPLSILSML